MFRVLLLTMLLLTEATAHVKPLKVFIPAEQPNMEGDAKVETFDGIGDDPATVPLLKKMCEADGRPRAREHVSISDFTGGSDNSGEGFGKLTTGYGSRFNPKESGGKVGPRGHFKTGRTDFGWRSLANGKVSKRANPGHRFALTRPPTRY